MGNVCRQPWDAEVMSDKIAPEASPSMSSGTVQVVSMGHPWPHPEGPQGWQTFYLSRRSEFEKSLTGKSYSNADVARAWQRSTGRADYTFETLSAEFPGNTLKGLVSPWLADPIKNFPLFTVFAENRLPVVPLFDDSLLMGLINAQTPFVEDYPPGRGEAAASGSLFHILVIPRCRAYNAVSLDGTIDASGKNSPISIAKYLSSVQDLSTKYVQGNIAELLRRAKEEAEGKIRALWKAESPEEVQRRVDASLGRMQAMWDSFLATGEKLDLGFFFHVHDDHTIGHMHTHVFPLNKSLRTNLVHDIKCVPLNDVLALVGEASPAPSA